MKLEVTDLNSHYGPAHILFDISLEVGDGEGGARLGPNGAGKSTTFRSIIGLVAQRSGRILFEGRDVSDAPTHAIVRGGLGYVPEERRIFTDLRVEKNREAAPQPARPNAPCWTREKIFALFPNLAEMRNRPGGRMSGGEQQMLTIARTLMGNPSLVLLDEPSEGLSPKIVEQMIEAILAMKQAGVSLVVSEQNLHFARLISDRAYIIERGRICFGGSMAELDARPDIRDAHLSLRRQRARVSSGWREASRRRKASNRQSRLTCSTSRLGSSFARSGSATARSSLARSAPTLRRRNGRRCRSSLRPGHARRTSSGA